MNELETAFFVRRALDEGAQRLNYKAQHRLEKARQLAVARMGQAAISEAQTQRFSSGNSLALGAGINLPGSKGNFWTSGLFASIPAVVLVVGFFAASSLTEQQRADEVAEVDAAMLTGDLPISLYADRGFGVFIKNTSQSEAE